MPAAVLEQGVLNVVSGQSRDRSEDREKVEHRIRLGAAVDPSTSENLPEICLGEERLVRGRAPQLHFNHLDGAVAGVLHLMSARPVVPREHPGRIQRLLRQCFDDDASGGLLDDHDRRRVPVRSGGLSRSQRHSVRPIPAVYQLRLR